MRGAGVKRAMWGVLLFGWPAVIIIKAVLHPEWGGDLSDGGASASFLCALALLLMVPHGRHAGRRDQDGPWLRRDDPVVALVAEHEQRLDDQDLAWQTWQAAAGRGRNGLRMITGGRREGA